MRKILKVGTIIFCWHFFSSKAFGHEPIFAGMPQDKILHFSVSEGGTSAMIKLGQAINQTHRITVANRLISSFIMLSLGYLKERKDMQITGNKFDYPDFAADAAGVIAGNIIQWEF